MLSAADTNKEKSEKQQAFLWKDADNDSQQ
jgi:hypothetical protein